ncbi:poly(3-hydroxyalkanoate) synthetase [Burkholderiales bacterium JOSHI_001]|nr:poly(3-hydroxyalkanoate) synthetase [Burkholderiales bacterium JOSHI_001]
MDAPLLSTGASPAPLEESPTQRLDRLLHAGVSPLFGGLSPVSLALAWADWAWHLGVSPGRQMELAGRAAQCANTTLAALAPLPGAELPDETAAGATDDDPRFRHPAWAQWPFSALRTGFRQAETFWQDAAHMPGMTAHHADMTRFFARQWLGMVAPANWLPTNPVVLKDALDSRGAHLLQGAMNWWHDSTGLPDPALQAEAQKFQVGRDVAATPGQVVWRNRLIELICYAPATREVYPEPLLVIPSWIMKYYILDLSPHNSMVRYLVGQGHTVYMVSWRNPDAGDHDLTMDDYLRLGVFDALQAIAGLQGERTAVHAMGYCLGGTLLAMGAAVLARRGGKRRGLPPLASLSLLAAQTDFSEPGELGLFIDESQVGFLGEITRGKGYLTGEQMAGSFQFLHSRDLVWTRRMKEYLMGEREQRSDLMAWNADTTRLPARMHHEYLTALYLHNALATSRYRVDGHAVSLADIRWPTFLVGTERDHISPWRSVFKLHHLCDAEITFVLTAGGHNAGIISEPGHPNRSYRMQTRALHAPWVEPDDWLQQAPRHPGSWWPAWHDWLAAHSGPRRRARPLPAKAKWGPAPGQYVMQRFTD